MDAARTDPVLVAGQADEMTQLTAYLHRQRVAGEPPPEPWASAPWEQDWEWHQAATWEQEEVWELYEVAVARAEAVLAGRRADQPAATTMRAGSPMNLRWVLLHLIEEYARHLGHADLIRESIDGQTG
ncbi:MAG: DUF664 domain-containing protein [Ornithinimicrobium sp.]|jgi:hypothetical protein|uniref:mycothiol transferase n=1 Tax=Ornithinimicrobium sp. TaxID=1977084 RepID=UPI003D9B5062